MTDFDYLLNRMELASQADEPAKHDYGGHRQALFKHVRNMELRIEVAERMARELRASADLIDAISLSEFNERGWPRVKSNRAVLAEWEALK